MVSHPGRWCLLRELASGEQFMVSELAERAGQTPDTTSKNLAVLHNAGIVPQGRNRLVGLAFRFIADKTERILNFGFCLLRMKFGASMANP